MLMKLNSIMNNSQESRGAYNMFILLSTFFFCTAALTVWSYTFVNKKQLYIINIISYFYNSHWIYLKKKLTIKDIKLANMLKPFHTCSHKNITLELIFFESFFLCFDFICDFQKCLSEFLIQNIFSEFPRNS